MYAWFVLDYHRNSGVRQGAIDLVQMELQWRDPRQAAARLRRYRQFYHPPRRLSSSTAAAPPQLEAALASASADPADSMERGGAKAEAGGQISSRPPAVAPSSGHACHAHRGHVAAAGERAAAAGTGPCAISASPGHQAAEPAPKLLTVIEPELQAKNARRAPLAELRHALRVHRKAPGDGLLHAPLRTGVALIEGGADSQYAVEV